MFHLTICVSTGRKKFIQIVKNSIPLEDIVIMTNMLFTSKETAHAS